MPENRASYTKVDVNQTPGKKSLKSKSARLRRRKLRKSIALEKNIKLYIEGQKLIPYDKKQHGHVNTVQTYTLMSQWTSFFIYFQVFYLIVIMIVLTVMTLILLFQKKDDDEDDIYQKYVLDQKDLWDEDSLPSRA